MHTKRKRIVAIDFFCGAGGVTRGLLDSGIRVLAGVDNDSRLKETYEKNNAPAQFLEQDICSIDISVLREKLGIRPSDIVIYAACAPTEYANHRAQRLQPHLLQIKNKEAIGYLLVGETVDTPEVRGKIDILKNSKIYVRLYSDLLSMVEKSHKDFLERYDSLKTKRDVQKR